jgi:O-antigen ligase
MWFIYTGSSGDASATADFARMVLFGLIPTALFTVTCWAGFRQGWPLWVVLCAGYAFWLVAMGLYRLIDSGWLRG